MLVDESEFDDPKDGSGGGSNNRGGGAAVAIGIGLSAGALMLLSSPFLIVPMVKKLGHIPWMVTPQNIIRQVFTQLKELPPPSGVGSQQARIRLVDLGSGDGRICIEAAKQGYHATGFEINPVLFTLSYVNAWRAGVLPNVTFKMSNFWNEDLQKYGVVTVFGIAPVVEKLMAKVMTESLPKTKVVSFRFPIRSQTPIWHQGELYIYEKQ